jgi:DNA polymerase III psi subunit
VTDSEQSLAKRRDHYLHTLGIVQYVPKGLDQDSEIDSFIEASPQNVDQPEEIKLSQQSSVDAVLQTDIEKSSIKKSDDQVKPQVKKDPPADELTLQLVFWQPTDELLIATIADKQLPDSQQVQLLGKIIATIDNQVSGLPQYDVIKWPPHSSMQGGEQEAREFLSTLINSRLAAKPTKLLLVLGESAQDWLLSMEQKKSVKDGMLAIAPSVTALIAPALDEMLNQPQSKRLTWQIICRYFNHATAPI